MHLCFDFWSNQHLWLALAQQDARPLIKALQQRAPLADESQWAVFLRNHDELDLGRLSEEQRAACFARFGPEKDMQLYDRGVRRRLAPMMGDRASFDLVRSVMLALPGTPVIYYGDEIGMGDDLSMPERKGVRLPMQWSDEDNAGFSRADADALPLAPQMDGPFGARHINVTAQRLDPHSALATLSRLISARRECPEIGREHPVFVDVDDHSVLALRYGSDTDGVLVVHNFGRDPAVVGCAAGRVVDIAANRAYPPCTPGAGLEVDGLGYRWCRLGHADRAVDARTTDPRPAAGLQRKGNTTTTHPAQSTKTTNGSAKKTAKKKKETATPKKAATEKKKKKKKKR